MKKNRAFTLIELLVVIAIIALLVGILLPALGKARASARQLKDATQIRNVVQAMVVFAQNNQDAYPLPSRMDSNNTTIAPTGNDIIRKDNTGNVLSILVFQGAVSTELCINPAESNTAQVVRDDRYQFADPQAAQSAYGGVSSLALWDPGFSGSAASNEAGGGQRRNAAGTLGTTDRVSHQSYAHNPPFGKRLNKWSNTFTTTEAVFGNRGPSYVETSYPTTGRYTLNPTGNARPGVDSNTLLIHGGRNTWSGNIGYNDAHVTFETKPNPDGVTYRRSGSTQPLTVLDNLFIDEIDEAGGTTATPEFNVGRANNFLRVIANPTNTYTNMIWYD